jgi:hypothetical protein
MRHRLINLTERFKLKIVTFSISIVVLWLGGKL